MSSDSPFVIVPRAASTRRRRWPLLGLLWLLSLAAVGWGVDHWRQRAASGAEASPEELRQMVGDLQGRLDNLRQRNVILKRSDDISREANQQLQRDIADRDERIASLEADVAFYERLVGGSAQRQGLSIHSLGLQAEPSGAWLFRLTLTQNVKKTQLSRGQARLAIEGVQDGRMRELGWADLTQNDAPGLEFAFKYFQQVEGNVMLPAGFTPHRIKVSVDGEAGRAERSFAWTDVIAGVAQPEASE
ncbi:DUF6776 family protein [uncultured Aquimonas sp.]|uniref:DUF6776 family protein n=1 Tax=uncultured Aquimonas sp. TaxID=385483 RepID=UPI00086DFEA3|nr:DUF6776 family protein [uncultured Aquimonas sp.]ODU43371.1 MAG: hypothetical protein ABS96_23415 [Xanthomonadaceae bacterium SCN 69-123]